MSYASPREWLTWLGTATARPAAFLVFDDIFGEVAKSELFRKRFAHAVKTLWEKGTRETLQLYLDGKLAV